MKKTLSVFLFLLLGLCLVSGAWTQNAPAKSPAPFLPEAFAGWQWKAPAQISRNPEGADPASAAVLKEYGFNEFESATYVRPDRSLAIKAIRFNDATGAYGAFTFYKTEEMQREQIGDQAASLNEHVMFYRGNILVEAVLDRVTVMSAGELRELADDLPLPAGPERNPPVLPLYLPKTGYVPNSAKYAVGPVALSKEAPPVEPSLVDFSDGAEVALGQYATSGGNAALMVISYPTPAIAGERLRAIEAAHPPASAAGQMFLAKRSGPLVVVVSGPMAAGTAKSLLASVNYDPSVTWNEATKLTRNENVTGLLAGIVILVIVILGLALVAGLAFGGLRLALRRLFPNRLFDRSQDIEIIQLNLGNRPDAR